MRPHRSLVVLCFVSTVLASSCQPPGPQAGSDSVGVAAPALTASDQLILSTAKVGLPPPGITAADLPEPSSAGAGLVATYCGQCHDLPAPAMHSATDWPSGTTFTLMGCVVVSWPPILN